MRLDKFLVENHHFTRNKAQQIIEAGLVFCDEKNILKPSFDVREGISIRIVDDNRLRWVSRSAQKLFDFLEHHPDLNAKIPNARCLDVGASTGGFTQVLIEKWAKSVDAVDVGTMQLHDSLRNHPRIFSFENTDIRDFSPLKKYDIIVCDASFIMLEKIFADMHRLSDEKTIFLLLFKPQFQVWSENLTRNGLPKNEKCIVEAMKHFEIFLQWFSVTILQKSPSTLAGEAGNQEWIYTLKNT